MWQFYCVTFGCKVNQYESHAIREAWARLGGNETQHPEHADVILVNSCAVTARGERDARNALYRMQRIAPQARYILTGCSAVLVAQKIQNTRIDLVIPPKAKALLMQDPFVLLHQYPHPADTVALCQHPFDAGFYITNYHRSRPVVKIQDGCSHRCTYCIVPLVRGATVSRSPQDILAEATRLLEAGYEELVLSGINLHQYAVNIGTEKMDFWDLLQYLDTHLSPRFAGQARLRLSSLEPSQLDARGIDMLLHCKMVCPHVHISLQSGSSDVLRSMGRGHYNPHKLPEALAQLRATWTHMGVGADILLGFPGEREEDVEQTSEIIRQMRLSYAHVFPYSVRPGTAAASFAQQVPHELKLERTRRIRTQVAQQQQRFLQSLAALPILQVISDTHSDTDAATIEASPSDTIETSCAGATLLRGISEHYAPCRILCDTHPSAIIPHKLRNVCPIKIEDNTLLVRPLL